MSDHVYHEIVEQCCDACMSCLNECKMAHGYCRDCDEYLCEPCFNSHLMVRVARNHVLLDSSEMPKERMQNISPENGSDIEQSMDCKTHPNNVIQLFCESHNELCCSICTAVKHTTRLCKVQYIPDIAKEVTKNGQVSLIQRNLQAVVKRTKVAEGNVEALVKQNEFQRENGLETVRQFADKLQMEMKKREEELSNQIESRYETNDNMISPILNKYHSVIAEADKLVNRLNKYRENENSVQLFIAYYEAKAKLGELETALAKTKLDKKIEEYSVTCDPQLVKLIEDPATVCYENVEKQQQKPATRSKSKRTPFQSRTRGRQDVNSEYLQPVTRGRLSSGATYSP